MSKEGWVKRKLQDICSLVTDGKHGDCENHENSGYYFISAKDVTNGKISYINARQITKQDFEDTHKRTQLEPFDVLLTNSGTIGRLALAGDNKLTRRTTFQKSVAILKPIKNKVTPQFLYYNLLSRTRDIINTASGTTQQNLLLGDLRAFELEITDDLATQNHIAAILSSLDDKIELNRQTNATLEAIAQAIFKEWFVDFNFPGATGEMQDSELGPIPKGWKVENLSNTVEIIGGGTPKTSVEDYWNGDIPWFSVVDVPHDSDVFVINTEKKVTQTGIDNSSTNILPEGTTIISARGTVGKIALSGVPMAMNQSCYGLNGKQDDIGIYTFYLTRSISLQLQKGANGSVFDTITRSTFEQMAVVHPPKEVIERFNIAINAVMMRIKENLYESSTLIQIRDNLLPKLMSGKICIKEVE